MVFDGLVGLGLAFLLAPAIAEIAKIRHKADMGFNFMTLAGIVFLFAASFTMLDVISAPKAWLEAAQPAGLVFQAIGWIVALIGVLFVIYETLLEK